MKPSDLHELSKTADTVRIHPERLRDMWAVHTQLEVPDALLCAVHVFDDNHPPRHEDDMAFLRVIGRRLRFYWMASLTQYPEDPQGVARFWQEVANNAKENLGIDVEVGLRELEGLPMPVAARVRFRFDIAQTTFAYLLSAHMERPCTVAYGLENPPLRGAVWQRAHPSDLPEPAEQPTITPPAHNEHPPCCRCGKPIDWTMTAEQRAAGLPYSNNPICTSCCNELLP